MLREEKKQNVEYLTRNIECRRRFRTERRCDSSLFLGGWLVMLMINFNAQGRDKLEGRLDWLVC